jgi:DNA mismatch repair protein MutL
MIRRLPPELVREIAAGEVITSPVDVVKELLENALDAGATRLEIDLIAGGTQGITVTDNGSGIARDELLLAVQAHSTSKLESLTSIHTFGFRGEGLHAIRHAARLELTSRTADQLGGATLSVEGDDEALREHPAPRGTRVRVVRLFARLPARRQALDSEASEGKKVLSLVGRYLLHHPSLGIRLAMDGEERLSHAGGSTRDVVKLLWGVVTANRLLPVEVTRDSLRVTGLLSRPELTRPRRDRLHLAVNGRPVEWPEALLRGILQAYRELLPGGYYPVGVLDLIMPPEEILVNTAPDKTRVRFLQEAQIVSFLQQAVTASLSVHPLSPALPELRPFEGVAPAPRHTFPALAYLGSYRDLYLLAEAQGQLWVVDQHAAHERILFEELEQRYRSEPPVELANAELLTLTPEEGMAYLEQQEDLAVLGLVLEPFGSSVWRLRRIPAFLAGHADLLPEVVKGVLNKASAFDAWRTTLARLACLPAVKAGHKLKPVSAQALLDTLGRCHTPWVCPHGRPTALVLDELDLARRFGRRSARAVSSEVPR